MKYWLLSVFLLLLVGCAEELDVSNLHGDLTEVYINENIRVRLKHAVDWTVEERENIILSSPEDFEGVKEFVYIHGINMGVYPIPLDDFADHSVKLLGETYSDLEHLGTDIITVDGNDARRINYRYTYSDQEYTGAHTIVILNNNIYVIVFASTKYDAHKDYVDSIISNMQFN